MSNATTYIPKKRPIGRPKLSSEPTVIVRRPIWPASLLLATETAAKRDGLSWQKWLRKVVTEASR